MRKDKESIRKSIKEIISSLRKHVQEQCLNATVVENSSQELACIGYKYDSTLFPSLPSAYCWSIPGHNAPQSLAEALLWKMGKWTIYKSFVEHYKNKGSSPKKTDVVFYAFAKHLEDPANPIYDQHALRALWAIDTNLNGNECGICSTLLTKKKDRKWKPIVSGANPQEGYDLYKRRVTQICRMGSSLSDLDKLLMPLGQAIKDCTEDIREFRQLAGLPQSND